MQSAFPAEKSCIKFLELIRWNNKIISPFDESSNVYKCRDGCYKCKNTGKEFNVLTGTLFQGTKLELFIWFEIIFREHSDRKGLTATTVSRDYGIAQTTAWFMLHKIRKCMKEENYQELKGIVETDEYYEGAFFKKHVLR